MFNSFTVGALAGGFLASVWGSFKSLLQWAIGLFVIRIELKGTMAAMAELYAWKKLQQTRSPFYVINAASVWIRSKKNREDVAIERLTQGTQLFWNGKRPLLLKNQAPNHNKEGGGTEGYTSIVFIRGTFDVDTLIKDIMTTFSEMMTTAGGGEAKRFRVNRHSGSGAVAGRRGSEYRGPRESSASPSWGMPIGRPIGYDWNDIGEPLDGSDPFARLALNQDILEALDEVKRWYHSKDWYQARGIPWRRGWLMHGKPGTGKTSVARAFGQALDMPINTFDIGTMSNQEFMDAWTISTSQAPCIVLIEDIDAVFEGRTNRLAELGGGLTFDCILNAISGVQQADGVFLIITTNNVAAIDSALSGGSDTVAGRPGRIDRVLELKAPDLAGRYRIARRILDQFPAAIDTIVANGDGMTGAQFQEVCVVEALKQYWASKAVAEGKLVSRSEDYMLEVCGEGHLKRSTEGNCPFGLLSKSHRPGLVGPYSFNVHDVVYKDEGRLESGATL